MSCLKLFAVGLALMLAACSGGSINGGDLAGGGTINWTHYDIAYTPITDISFAGGSGELLTQILGNPFSVPQAQFDKAVTDAMYGAHFGPPTHFTTTPVGDFRRMFYVRLVFGSSFPVSINTICIAPPEPPRIGANQGEVRVFAAFCQEGRPLTYLEGGGKGYSGPTDPQFVAFVKQVTYNLFPPRNPELFRNQPDNCRFPSC